MAPLLDFAALQSTTLREVAPLPGLDHPSFHAVLEAVMPGVRYSGKRWPAAPEEHSLVDPATGSAVRIVITWERSQARSCTRIAEIGSRRLWTELVDRLGEWERHSRTMPPHWHVDAQLRTRNADRLCTRTAPALARPERPTARADEFVLPLEDVR